MCYLAVKKKNLQKLAFLLLLEVCADFKRVYIGRLLRGARASDPNLKP